MARRLSLPSPTAYYEGVLRCQYWILVAADLLKGACRAYRVDIKNSWRPGIDRAEILHYDAQNIIATQVRSHYLPKATLKLILAL
jgi:hypothetical protein